MSVNFSGVLLGDKISTELTHEQGAVIRTTPPKDNGGDGTYFSPTDLCAVSLGACGATTAGLFAKRNNIDLKEIKFFVQKEMSSVPPRKIAQINVSYVFDTKCSDVEFIKLVNSAKTCPVKNTLSPDVIVVEEFKRIQT